MRWQDRVGTDAESRDAAHNRGVLRDNKGVVDASDGVVGAARAAEALGSHDVVCWGVVGWWVR